MDGDIIERDVSHLRQNFKIHEHSLHTLDKRVEGMERDINHIQESALKAENRFNEQFKKFEIRFDRVDQNVEHIKNMLAKRQGMEDVKMRFWKGVGVFATVFASFGVVDIALKYMGLK